MSPEVQHQLLVLALLENLCDSETLEQRCQIQQKSTIIYFIDKITLKNKEDIDSALGRAICVSGTPLLTTENRYWQQALN